MKNFVKENWYKLMVGSSMLMASFGFMINAVSPAYSNSEKTDIKNTNTTSSPIEAKDVIVGDDAFFVDGGYVYRLSSYRSLGNWKNSSSWSKFKLP